MPLRNLQPSADFNARVMRRVRLVYYTKKVVNPFVMECCGSVALGVVALRFVSVSQVIQNSPSFADWNASSRFWTSAWQGTEFSIQGISLALGVLVVLLGIQTVKIVRTSKRQKMVPNFASLVAQK